MNEESNGKAKVGEPRRGYELPASATSPPHEIIPADAKLPIPLSSERRRLEWRRLTILLVLLAVGGATVLLAVGGAGGAFYWLKYSQPSLLPGIFSGNDRLEADAIAGPVAELFADEDDVVKGGQVVVDTKDLEAYLKKAEARVLGTQRALLDEARANVAQQQSQLTLAQQQLDRIQSFVQGGYAIKELLDQRRQQVDASTAHPRCGAT